MEFHQPGVRLAPAAALVAIIAVAGLTVAARGQESRDLPRATDGHRVLRDNATAVFLPPTEPQNFAGFPGAPNFSVVPRPDVTLAFPCATCHSLLPLNPEPRRLMAPHPVTLNHGDGRFWCLGCHDAENRVSLRTLAGDEVAFDDAHLVCGQCHYEPQKDWYFGAHGKRAGNWQGERTIYGCSHCHDPHDPSVKPRAPEPPPPVRKGLVPMPAMQSNAPRGHRDDETTAAN